MNPSITKRINGTKQQAQAQQIRALASYSLHLQRNTKLTAEMRFQALKIMLTR